ncbi:MAG: MmcQ/YjbR family DNA-binding protein [Butyricimonas paravirosa]
MTRLGHRITEKYPEITSAYHFNKKYWNGINMHGTLSDKFIEELIEHSYRKLSKNFRKAL